MIVSVDCINRWSAIDLKPTADTAMISILDEGVFPDFSLPGWENILYLRFHDLHNIISPAYRYFDSGLAESIMVFTDKLHHASDDFKLIIHCEAGVSRSAAVAYWVSKNYNIELPDGFELRTSPNVLVLKELFSLSLNEDVKITQRLIICDTEDSFFGSPSKNYYEYDIIPCIINAPI